MSQDDSTSPEALTNATQTLTDATMASEVSQDPTEASRGPTEASQSPTEASQDPTESAKQVLVFSDRLTFPSGYLKDSKIAGIGIDIGGSLMKVAYFSPLADDGGDTVTVHMEAYDVTHISLVLAHLVHTLGSKVQPETVVYTTGVGCNRYAQQIQTTLNAKITNVVEASCNTATLKFFVEHFPLRDYVHKPCQQARPFLYKQLENFEILVQFFAQPGDGTSTQTPHKSSLPKLCLKPLDYLDDVLPNEEELGKTLALEDTFPASVCMFGSGSFTVVVYADGLTEYVDINTSCGRTMLALGSLLVGTKTFDELLTLAEQGDSAKVDQTVGDMTAADTKDAFKVLPDDTIMYSYGKAVGRSIDDFSKADLAAAVISQTAQTLAQNCYLALLASPDVKTVFFCGNVCDNSELMRTRITERYGTRTLYRWQNQRFYFLKYGGFIGALGGLIMSSRNQASE